MERNEVFRSALLAMAVFVLVNGQAQVSVDQNSPIFPGTDYVGWDNNTTVPLMVRHNGNQPIQWWTDSIQRMQLYHTRTGTLPLLGGGTINVQQDGYLGLSGTPGFFATNGYGPFSRLHLADLDPNSEGQNHYNQPWGYRSWMKNGMTLTGNHDHAYIGQRYYGHDSTDLVIHWSDNAEKSPFGPDRLRFIFTTDNTGATQGSRSQEGLEFMRMYPVNQNQGFVGIGNFAQPGISPDPEPSERLDILDQTIRIRRLVPDYEDDQLDRLVVTDANGRLHWRDVSSLPAPPDNCEWTMGANPNPNHVWTAVGAADPDCPDEEEFVGIGTNAPSAKLSVEFDPASGAGMTVIRADADGGADSKIGGGFYTDGTGLEHYGVQARCYNGAEVNTGGRFWGELTNASSFDLNIGVEGLTNVASGSTVTDNISLRAAGSVAGTTTNNFGVHSRMWNTGSVTNNFGGFFDAWTSSNSANNYGLYTMASGGSTAWALFVNGTQFSTTSNIFSTSDPSLKTNIQPADRQTAVDLMNAIPLYTYEFDPSACPQMNLPTGTQLGVMAPELEALMPQMVRDVHQPAAYDQAGNVLHPGKDLKAVSYTGFIPYLMAAFQEQQATITTLQDQLAAVQQDLASCCADRSGSEQRGSIPGAGAGEALRTDLFIVPNPVADHTQLRYTVATPGRTRLEVSDASGKRLEVLEEAVREAGAYTHDWTTTDLAPGTYHVTQFLNDSFVVKKAVKVAR